MSRLMKKRFGNGNSKKTDEFCKKFDLNIPDDYRKFIIDENGGEPFKNSFLVETNKELVSIELLFGLVSEKRLQSCDVEKWMIELGSDLSVGMIPIGKDIYGNLFVLGTGTGFGFKGVFYWDVRRVFPQSTDRSNVYPLTKTFSEFTKQIEDQNPVGQPKTCQDE